MFQWEMLRHGLHRKQKIIPECINVQSHASCISVSVRLPLFVMYHHVVLYLLIFPKQLRQMITDICLG